MSESDPRLAEHSAMRVCFVAENAYPAIAGRQKLRHDVPFGGMETQAWAFARALQHRDACEVSFAVCSPERFDKRTHQGISVHNRRVFFEHVRRDVARYCEVRHGWPPLRIRRFRLSLLWQIPLLAFSRPFRSTASEQRSIEAFYRNLPADVVIVFGVSSLTTAVVEAARNAGKKVVISCASNDDLRAEYQIGSDYVNAYGDRGDVLARGLMAANRVFVQTEWQQQLAEKNLNVATEVLPNPVDDEWQTWAWDREAWLKDLLLQHPCLRGTFVLWTGRTDRFHKRPEMALEIARQLPHLQFVMVLNVTDPVLGEELFRKRPANVLILAPISHPAFVALMSLATAFLSTGSRQYEGFPNVFLQAGILRVPVVSADCDFGILGQTGIGRSFDDRTGDMIRFLDQLCTQPDLRTQMMRDVPGRVQERYGSATISERLWELLAPLQRLTETCTCCKE